MAVAWGVPDKESMGYSSVEFTRILHKALKPIEYPGTELHKITFSLHKQIGESNGLRRIRT